MADFDPYYQWLAIPPKDQPPDHYRLLGVDRFESNSDVIAHAADRQMIHICSFQTGKHADLSQQLLNEISAAKICLLNPEKKAAYDRQLREQSASWRSEIAPSVVPPCAGDLAFLESSTTVPRAILKTKPKRELRRNRIWLGSSLLAAVLATVALIAVLIINSGQDKKEVAATESEPVSPLAEKKPVSPRAPYRTAEPARQAEPRSAVPDTPPQEPASSRPVAGPEKPGVPEPHKPAEPNSSLAGILRPRPVNDPDGDLGKPDELPAQDISPAGEKHKPTGAGERPIAALGAAEDAVPADGRLAIPDEAAQNRALAMIRETYKDDYLAADKAALAKRLRGKADEARGDTLARFALLQEAKKVAVETGQGELSFEIIDAMAAEFQVHAADLKAQVIDQAIAAKKVHTPQQQKAVALAALRVMDVAVADDDFDVARRLGKQAMQMAKLTKEREFVQLAQSKTSHMEAMAKAYVDVQKGMARLKEKPSDPDANLSVGKYLCCKDHWEKALPMLALGSDAAVKQLAKADIEGADTPEEQVRLADGWWDLAQGLKGEWREAVLSRAGAWYQQAKPNLTTALAKGLVEKRLETIGGLGHDIARDSNKPPPLAMAPFSGNSARQYQTRWAKYLGKPAIQTNSIGMKLVLIPPGEFAMGSPQSLIQEESQLHGGESWRRGTLPADVPQHRVKITNPFWLGATAVTQEEYQRVMGSNPSKFPGDPKKPVEQVSWYDAVEFCRKLSGMTGENAAAYRYELPTEAQWEYACRAGNLGSWYFSDRANPLPMAVEEKMLGEYAWCGDARGQTHPAGQKRANPWGLYDMYGNVWQWCQDWFDKDYYEKSPTDEPVGPPGGAARVRRGGGWDSPPSHCRSAYREGIAPKDRYSGLGFRVCQIPISP